VHPQERAAFDRAMVQGWLGRLERLDSVEWRGDETVVDVGGGDGSLLRALLERRPRLRGIVFDLPETVRDESSFGDRCTFVAGSFFDVVPAGDVFVLSTVLHDWDDASALRILQTVRAAAGETARLVLLEGVIEPGNDPDGAKWLDLLMLTLFAGRERTERQWRRLLADAGFEPVRFGPGVIEARSAERPGGGAACADRWHRRPHRPRQDVARARADRQRHRPAAPGAGTTVQ
jgi:O-methyltransferase domain